jgi:hypothetical protein
MLAPRKLFLGQRARCLRARRRAARLSHLINTARTTFAGYVLF